MWSNPFGRFKNTCFAVWKRYNLRVLKTIIVLIHCRFFSFFSFRKRCAQHIYAARFSWSTCGEIGPNPKYETIIYFRTHSRYSNDRCYNDVLTTPSRIPRLTAVSRKFHKSPALIIVIVIFFRTRYLKAE